MGDSHVEWKRMRQSHGVMDDVRHAAQERHRRNAAAMQRIFEIDEELTVLEREKWQRELDNGDGGCTALSHFRVHDDLISDAMSNWGSSSRSELLQTLRGPAGPTQGSGAGC